jgi:putative FmdB family regulatory protein
MPSVAFGGGFCAEVAAWLQAAASRAGPTVRRNTSVPIYTYVCKDCGKDLEVRQDFHDAALTVCPHCGGHLRKAFTAVGVVFKGSGFYRNDSREQAKQAKQPEKAASGSSDGRGDSAARTSSEKGSDKIAAKADSGSSSGSTSSSPAKTAS